MDHWLITRESRKSQRGAALILEMIVYLVIVALIFVAVISTHRYYRELTYVMHAKQDARHVQEWTMGEFSYNGTYPNREVTTTDVKLTVADGNVNDAEVKATQGPSGNYCVFIVSNNISNPLKNKFWIKSAAPNIVIQSELPGDLPCLPTIPSGNVDPDSDRFPVCHNGDEMLSLPITAIENGHDGHSEDIIPPIPAKGFDGINWNDEGAKIFAACG